MDPNSTGNVLESNKSYPENLKTKMKTKSLDMFAFIDLTMNLSTMDQKRII